MGYNARSLLFFNEAGEQVDTVPSLFPVLPEKGVQDIASISVIKQGNAAIVLSNFKDGENSASITGIPFLWKSDGKRVLTIRSILWRGMVWFLILHSLPVNGIGEQRRVPILKITKIACW